MNYAFHNDYNGTKANVNMMHFLAEYKRIEDELRNEISGLQTRHAIQSAELTRLRAQLSQLGAITEAKAKAVNSVALTLQSHYATGKAHNIAEKYVTAHGVFLRASNTYVFPNGTPTVEMILDAVNHWWAMQ